MKAKQIILSRLLPKTGQDYPVITGDDGTYQTGWWTGRTVATNKTRFIAKTLAGGDVVIDLATGLMWAADGSEAGCNNGGTISFTNAIPYGLALDFAGFTDWRVPNVNELLSIVAYKTAAPVIYGDFFTNTVSGRYWSSTVYYEGIDKSKYVDFALGAMGSKEVYTLYYLRCVRKGL